MKLKLIYFIFILSISFFSCREVSGTKKDIKLSKKLQPIVDSLMVFNVVHDDAIGYSGDESNVYLNFKKLMTLASDDELISLIDHDSASVRAYSFWALAKRKNIVVKNILDQHLNDSAKFFFMSGCTVGQEKINEFYLNLLTPDYLDISCIKLTPKEVEIKKIKLNFK